MCHPTSRSKVSTITPVAQAFESPVDTEIKGQMISGAENSVRLLDASLSDFIIMNAHAVGGRDKPKDVYDPC